MTERTGARRRKALIRTAMVLLVVVFLADASLVQASRVEDPVPSTPPGSAPAVAPAPAPVAATPPATQAPATAGQISGTVQTPSRRPVGGASVAVMPNGGGGIFGGSTSIDGRFALRGLPTASYAVLVMDPGGSVLRKERVNVRPLFRNLVDFITEPAGSPRPHLPSLPPPTDGAATFSLAGSLTAPDGQPISEAWVHVIPMGMEAPILRARTDAGGRFRLLQLAAGAYRITVRALGHVTWSLGPLFLDGGAEIDLRLAMLPFILGHPENPEDLLVPVEAMSPEEFEKSAGPPPPRP